MVSHFGGLILSAAALTSERVHGKATARDVLNASRFEATTCPSTHVDITGNIPRLHNTMDQRPRIRPIGAWCTKPWPT